MSLVSTTIPNLVNGVSQQPYALRLSSQAEVQINGYSSVVEGLRKRPPSRFRGLVSNTALPNSFTHIINRDTSERYVVVIVDGNLRVFGLDGSEMVVNFPDGKSYLSAADPDITFKAVTIADYTFILNTSVVTKESADLSPVPQAEAIVWVKQGGYGLKYEISVHGSVTKTLTTADGSQPAHSTQISTDKIADELYNAFAGDTTFTGQYEITKAGSSLRFRRKDGGDFTISYSDGLGDQGMKLVKGSVQRFSDLPARGFDGFHVEITGDASSSFDNYYARFTEAEGNPYNGVWMESLRGGQKYRLDGSTLPHALVREANGEFSFKRVAWEERKTGDEEASPMPSFIGRTINDIFFHRNRLGLVADENLIMSASGDFFRFFRASATQLLDTDPIDIGVSHTKVSILRHAVPFNETLLLFSDQTQFMLGASELLTPATISVNQTTEFQASLKAKPVGAGRNVYFTINKGAYSGVREYYVDGDTKTNDATDITSHVPSYVPGDITKLAASTNEDVLVAYSPRKPNELYVYKFFFQEGEGKLQSAWSHWEFSPGTRILNVEFIESDLWLLLERAGQVVFETVSLEAGATDMDLGFEFHLDQKCTEDDCTVTYNPTSDTTTITPPYTVEAPQEFVLVGAGEDDHAAGQVIQKTFNSGAFVVSGQLTKFILGRRYEFRYRFSTLVVKEEAPGGGMMTIGSGSIQLRKMTLSYSRTGYFRTIVTPHRRTPYVSVFSGRVIGSGNNVMGEPALEEGRFSFGILGQNETTSIEIVNDTHLPCAFLGAEWEALFIIRSRRL